MSTTEWARQRARPVYRGLFGDEPIGSGADIDTRERRLASIAIYLDDARRELTAQHDRSVRALTAERDTLAARVATLEAAAHLPRSTT